MARRQPTLALITVQDDGSVPAIGRGDVNPADGLVDSLRFASAEALSHVERTARDQSIRYRLAVRELKVRQRQLRFARRSLDSRAG